MKIVLHKRNSVYSSLDQYEHVLSICYVLYTSHVIHNAILKGMCISFLFSETGN